MDVRLILGGRILEDESFWAGFNTVHRNATEFEGVDLVVQPCIVESQPRTLLCAMANGIPVITTHSSGLHPDSAAQFVPVFDANALRAAILTSLEKQQAD